MRDNSSSLPVASCQKNSSQLSALSSQEKLAGRDVWRWVKFNLVSGIGICVQLVALALLRSWLKLEYLPATALGVEAAVIHNFLWHERFTWRDRPSARPLQSLVRFARFNATNGAVSVGGNLLIMRMLVGEWCVNYLVANLAAVTICSLANFLLSDRVVFEDAA